MASCKNLTEEQAGLRNTAGETDSSLIQVDAAYSKYDLNGDQKLDYREFC